MIASCVCVCMCEVLSPYKSELVVVVVVGGGGGGGYVCVYTTWSLQCREKKKAALLCVK